MNTNSTPLVSIGMPIYNGGAYMRESIDSVLEQSYPHWELIISDNCSTDETAKICQAYVDADPRVIYYRQPENIGAQPNFRFTLDRAQGTYFMWAAADDKLAPEFVQRAYEVMQANPHLVLAMSDVVNIDEKGQALVRTEITEIRSNQICVDWDRKQTLFFKNPTTNIFFCIYGLYQTDALRSAQLNYKGRLKYLAGLEIPFLAQISLRGMIGSIPEPLKYYRRHSESGSTQEAVEMGLRHFIANKVNISYVLLCILKDADLSWRRKLTLAHTAVASLLGYFSYLLLRKVLTTLGLRREPK